MCPQRFRKVPFSSVHRYTRKQLFLKKFNSRERCRKVPFSLHKIRVDGSRIRKEEVAFSNENEYVYQLSVESVHMYPFLFENGDFFLC